MRSLARVPLLILFLNSVSSTVLVAETTVSPVVFANQEAEAQSGVWPAASRGLTIYDSAIFDAIPDGPIRITSFNLRPDTRHPVGASFGFENLLLEFFVTPVESESMSLKFEENLQDAITDPFTVFNDEWTSEVINADLPGMETRPFDFKVPLTTPFVFDPADGNLLVDWVFGSPISGQASFDTSLSVFNDQKTIWAGGKNPQTGFNFFSVVTQFEFEPALEPLAGDWDGDGTLTEADVNLLTAAIINGAHELRFDLTDDGLVEETDLAVWVHDLKGTWFGDADLDGEFTSADFVTVFQAGKFETELDASWSEGDWNADGIFSSGDFVAAFQDGGYEVGPRLANQIAVPEPSSLLLVASGLVGIALHWRRQRQLTM